MSARRRRPSTRRAPGRRDAIDRGAAPQLVDARAPRSSSVVLLRRSPRLIQPTYGPTGIQGLAISVLPLALAAVAQAIVVISGGIDLSIGSMMALTSVVAAAYMQDQSDQFADRRRDRRAAARLAARGGQRRPDRGHARSRHRRHPGDVLRLGRLRAARPEDAGRRLGAVAQGPGPWAAWQRVDPQGRRRPDRHRRASIWIPVSTLAARPVACTRSAAIRWPRSAAACRSAGRRSSRTCSAGCSPRSAAWPSPRAPGVGHAGSRAVHAA